MVQNLSYLFDGIASGKARILGASEEQVRYIRKIWNENIDLTEEPITDSLVIVEELTEKDAIELSRMLIYDLVQKRCTYDNDCCNLYVHSDSAEERTVIRAYIVGFFHGRQSRCR